MFVIIIMMIGSAISPQPPVNEEIIHHTIDNIEYLEKTVEKGVFTTKSEDHEYIDIIYTDGETGEKETVIFIKEKVKIGDKTELFSKSGYRSLYLSEEEYKDFFYQNEE